MRFTNTNPKGILVDIKCKSNVKRCWLHFNWLADDSLQHFFNSYTLTDQCFYCLAKVNKYSPKWRWMVVDIYRASISTTFSDTEVNKCFSIYHTSWITSGPKSKFICDNIPTKAILFFFGCSEVNGAWLITSELANQCARKVLFTCVVSYTKGAFVWDYSGIRMYSGIYSGYSAPGSRIARMEPRYSGMRIAPKQTLTCIIPIILIPDWSQTNAPLMYGPEGNS